MLGALLQLWLFDMGFKVRSKLAGPERPVKTHSVLNTRLQATAQKLIAAFSSRGTSQINVALPHSRRCDQLAMLGLTLFRLFTWICSVLVVAETI